MCAGKVASASRLRLHKHGSRLQQDITLISLIRIKYGRSASSLSLQSLTFIFLLNMMELDHKNQSRASRQKNRGQLAVVLDKKEQAFRKKYIGDTVHESKKYTRCRINLQLQQPIL